MTIHKVALQWSPTSTFKWTNLQHILDECHKHLPIQKKHELLQGSKVDRLKCTLCTLLIDHVINVILLVVKSHFPKSKTFLKVSSETFNPLDTRFYSVHIKGNLAHKSLAPYFRYFSLHLDIGNV